MDTFEAKIRPALSKQHPEMTKDAVQVFKRKWEVSSYISKKIIGKADLF